MQKKMQQIYRSVLKKIIKPSKRIVLPGFEGIPLYDVIIFFINKVQTVGLNERAAAISFNFIMAIPPACIFLFSLVPLMPWASDFSSEIIHFVNDITPNHEVRQTVKDFVDDFFGRPRSSMLSISFLLQSFIHPVACLVLFIVSTDPYTKKKPKAFLCTVGKPSN